MEIKQVPIAELQPHPKNPRVHPDSALDRLVRSIQEFGWTNPILVSADGLILAGHARLKAAQRAGLETVPVIYLPLSGALADAYLIADNKLAELTEWDEDQLASLIQELGAAGVDLELTGFNQAEIDELLDDGDGARAPRSDPDDVPEPPSDPITQPGDLWRLGRHRLLCGDSTSERDLELLMNGRKASLFATDPPYLVDYTGADRPGDSGKDWSADYREIDISDAAAFFRAVFGNAIQHLEPNAAWYCWHAHKRAALIEQVWAELGVINHQQIIWVKPTALHGFSFYPYQHEPCLMGWRKGHKPAHDGDNSHQVTSVWNIDWEGKSRPVDNEHPTQKPVEIFARPQRKHTQPMDICLETFLGSGSQLIAAELTGRVCYAMELSPRFVDVAVRRWEEYTGQKAERVPAEAVPAHV